MQRPEFFRFRAILLIVVFLFAPPVQAALGACMAGDMTLSATADDRATGGWGERGDKCEADAACTTLCAGMVAIPAEEPPDGFSRPMSHPNTRSVAAMDRPTMPDPQPPRPPIL
jgi:hypothetical protein